MIFNQKIENRVGMHLLRFPYHQEPAKNATAVASNYIKQLEFKKKLFALAENTNFM